MSKILLDTNIVFEMMKTSPDLKVINWLNKQEILDLYISTISIAEIHYGIHVLPNGKKRSLLEKSFIHLIDTAFQLRILLFDELSAKNFGIIMGTRKLKGRPMSIPDGQIAAISKANECVLVTRNINDFLNCNIDLVNPFLI